MALAPGDLKVSISPSDKSSNIIRCVIGKTVTFNVNFSNISTTDTIYNLGLTLNLPDGISFVSSSVIPSTNIINSSFSNVITFINIKDLYPNEVDYKLSITVKKPVNLNTIKEAYYANIKKYPPEKYPEEFIKINNAYNNLVNYYENNCIGADIFKDIIRRIAGRKLYGEKLIDTIKKLLSRITLDNFKYANNYLVDMIMWLKKNGYCAEALLICYLCELKFRKMKLIRLADSYIKLELYIVNLSIKN